MKLSIITINYNNRDGLQKTVDSVVSQTYKNFEWIIVNDCSTDNSDEVIRDLLQKLPTTIAVRYLVNEQNLGKHRSWNKALTFATGDLWICGDCDDSFNAKALEIFNERWNLVCDDDKQIILSLVHRLKK